MLDSEDAPPDARVLVNKVLSMYIQGFDYLLRLPGAIPIPAFDGIGDIPNLNCVNKRGHDEVNMDPIFEKRHQSSILDLPLVVRMAKRTKNQVRDSLGIARDALVVLITFGGFSITQTNTTTKTNAHNSSIHPVENCTYNRNVNVAIPVVPLSAEKCLTSSSSSTENIMPQHSIASNSPSVPLLSHNNIDTHPISTFTNIHSLDNDISLSVSSTSHLSDENRVLESSHIVNNQHISTPQFIQNSSSENDKFTEIKPEFPASARINSSKNAHISTIINSSLAETPNHEQILHSSDKATTTPDWNPGNIIPEGWVALIATPGNSNGPLDVLGDRLITTPRGSYVPDLVNACDVVAGKCGRIHGNF